MFNMDHTICFHNGEKSNFGIFEIEFSKPVDYEENIPTFDIAFSVDISSSMSDRCADDKMKIKHIKHTMNNLLKILSEKKEIIVNVYLQTFNDTVMEIFDFIQINQETVVSLQNKINNIIPSGSTDLKLPIEKMNEIMKKRENEFPEHKRIHIEMTDGEDTCDNSEDVIIKIVNPNYKNIFIGFGGKHNSTLLDLMASTHPNHEYRFVDKMELCGFVYGEIIHNLCCLLFEKAEINIYNGEIYDWRNNIWTKNVKIGYFSHGTKKTYHIRSDEPSKIYCVFTALYCFQQNPFVKYDCSNVIQKTNLLKYIYRQKIQELLYDIKKSSIYKNDSLENYKDMLYDCYNEIKQNIKGDESQDDIFWKVLLDDVYVVYKSIGTKYAHMYTSSRHYSQCRQDTYFVNNVVETCEDTPPKPKLIRTTNHPDSLGNYISFLQHTVLDNILSPYTNEDVLQTMKLTSDY